MLFPLNRVIKCRGFFQAKGKSNILSFIYKAVSVESLPQASALPPPLIIRFRWARCWFPPLRHGIHRLIPLSTLLRPLRGLADCFALPLCGEPTTTAVGHRVAVADGNVVVACGSWDVEWN